MADWLNISSGSDSEDESNNEVFEFEHGSYLTEFDDGYDPKEDPDFEDSTGLSGFSIFNEFVTLKMITSNGDDINEEFEEGDAFDDTQICFKTGKHPPENTWYSWANLVSLGPCKHMCCIVRHLKPIHAADPMDTFLKHHSELYVGCTDKRCKNPNANGILFKAIMLAKASRIFNPRTAAKLKSTSKAFKITFRR